MTEQSGRPAAEPLLERCERLGLGFIPWSPLATGKLAKPGSVLEKAAQRHNSTPAQLALAWLLHRSPVTMPIPGTSKVTHLEENAGAATIKLDPAEVAQLTDLA